jgi:beta-galactosidase
MVTFPFRSLVLSGFLALFAYHFSFSQVIFREVPDYKIRAEDSLFFDLSESRSIILLNGNWSVRPADDDEAPKISVIVPSIFEGDGELLFEKEFELSKSQILGNTLELVFFSINYTADISLNNTIIHRHSGGEYPFKVSLPRDILKSDKKNLLSLKLIYELDSKNSIPQKQRFLFPQNRGGIIGDVYIHLKPDFYIAKEKLTTNFSADYKNISLQVESLIKNNKTRASTSGVDNQNEYKLIVSVSDAAGNIIKELPAYNFFLDRNKDITITQKLDLSGTILWSPETPSSYILKQQLFKSDSLIDKRQKLISLFDLKSEKESIKLNGNEYFLKGVTYYPGSETYGKLVSYDQMEKDVALIKEAGFNSVRFAKSTIHPYYLTLCEKYGLLAFLEIPINGLPKGIAKDESFISRSKEFLYNYISFYGEYSSFAAIGFGGTYLPDLEEHLSLISVLAEATKEKTKLLTYASFSGINLPVIDKLDLYGIELMKNGAANSDEQIKQLQSDLGRGKIFFSSVTYPVYIGGSDGYLNEYSFEAQAKFYEEFFDYIAQNKGPAFFINSFNDYFGDYSSFLCGGSDRNLYRLGLMDENRSKNRISYKVVYSKLNNLEKVTIPIGNKKDDSPMIFIVFGLLLAIFMGVLVNSGRKFRDDASRALLRPYNFFSDVRDQRIISASQTTLLGLIIAAVIALIISNILFHLKTNLVFEHVLLAFASPMIMKTATYLAWHPFMSLVWLTIFNIVLFVIIALVIKIASFFVKTKVFIVSVYFTFIWSLLPVVLLIPVGIILYRVLLAGSINLYIYFGLGFVILWILHRLMKGIYVLFDSKPGTVYLYCSMFLLALIGSVLFYYELKDSTVQYILFAFKQFNIF